MSNERLRVKRMAAGYEKHVVVGYYFMSQYADVLVSGKIKAHQ